MSAQNNNEPVIEARNVALSFGRLKVLHDINLVVRRGETVVVMGGSGCGKTTLLKIMMGVHRPDSGEMLLFGRDISKMTRDELNQVRRRFGIVFQAGALYNSMTVGENVALPLKEHTDLDDNIIEIMVKMKLELVGLRGYENYMPSEISGGMKKRVGLARAIALDPEILFYDEPTAGLDPITSGVITQLILDLNKKLGVTSVVVTHDRECAFKVADRIAMMYQGKFLEEGSPEQIKNSTNPIVRQFIEGAPDGPIPLRQSSTKYIEDLVGEGTSAKAKVSALKRAVTVGSVLLFVFLLMAGMLYIVFG